MHLRPVAPAALPGRLADLVESADSPHPRLAIDGPAWSGAADLADGIAAELRLRGRDVVRVSTRWWLRPASVRLELGRTDPDSFYDRWLDVDALGRELLGPLGPDGDGRHLTTYRDPHRDRSTRQEYADAVPGAVLVLDGPLLLGQGLALDIAVHIALSGGARARRVLEDERWTLPAYDRYESEVDPSGLADAVIRWDDVRHPALGL